MNIQDNKYEKNSQHPNVSQFQNKYQNQNNNNNYNKNIIPQNLDNLPIENEIVKNNYFFILNPFVLLFESYNCPNFLLWKMQIFNSRNLWKIKVKVF